MDQALVIDNGAGFLRAGFAADRHPRVCVFPRPPLSSPSSHSLSAARRPRSKPDLVFLSSSSSPSSPSLPRSLLPPPTTPPLHSTVPNCVARIKKDVRVLVADEVETVVRDTAQLHIVRPAERGHVIDWDTEAGIWERVLGPHHLNVHAPDHPLVVSAAALAPSRVLPRLYESAFERFHFPSVWAGSGAHLALLHAHERAQTGEPRSSSSSSSSSLTSSTSSSSSLFSSPSPASSSPLPALASALGAALVVESGFSFTQVTPFVRGRAVTSAIRRLDVGGKALTNHLKELVSFRQVDLREDFFLVDRLKTRLSFVARRPDDDLARLARLGSASAWAALRPAAARLHRAAVRRFELELAERVAAAASSAAVSSASVAAATTPASASTTTSSNSDGRSTADGGSLAPPSRSESGVEASAEDRKRGARAARESEGPPVPPPAPTTRELAEAYASVLLEDWGQGDEAERCARVAARLGLATDDALPPSLVDLLNDGAHWRRRRRGQGRVGAAAERARRIRGWSAGDDDAAEGEEEDTDDEEDDEGEEEGEEEGGKLARRLGRARTRGWGFGLRREVVLPDHVDRHSIFVRGGYDDPFHAVQRILQWPRDEDEDEDENEDEEQDDDGARRRGRRGTSAELDLRDPHRKRGRDGRTKPVHGGDEGKEHSVSSSSSSTSPLNRTLSSLAGYPGASDTTQSVFLDSERFLVPELLFRPADIGLRQAGLPELIAQSLEACAPELRPLLAGSIVLVGGNVRLPGLAPRLADELRSLLPSDTPVRLWKCPSPDLATWRGAAAVGRRGVAHGSEVRSEGSGRRRGGLVAVDDEDEEEGGGEEEEGNGWDGEEENEDSEGGGVWKAVRSGWVTKKEYEEEGAERVAERFVV